MVADCVLLVASAENGVDDFGIYSLSSMFAQGLPASVLAVQVSLDFLTLQSTFVLFERTYLHMTRVKNENTYNVG